MENETMTEQQSLEVIRQMISESQSNYKEGAIYFLVWGWAISLAALVQYAQIVYALPFNTVYSWAAAIGLSSIWATIAGFKKSNVQKRKTFIERCMSGLWLGSIGMTVVMLMIGSSSGWVIIYPIMMATYSWGTLTSGVILKFNPLIFGGIGGFIIAIFSVFVQSELLLIMLVLTLISANLVPGYLLKYQQ